MQAKRNFALHALPIACVAVFTLGACQQNNESAQAKAESKQMAQPGQQVADETEAGTTPVTGEWKLVSIDSTELRGDATPRIVFGDEGLCWGNTGINDFRSSFSTGQLNRLKVGPAAVTRKAGPPEAMAVEKLFLERLQSAVSFEVKGDLLFVNSGENRNVTFERIYR